MTWAFAFTIAQFIVTTLAAILLFSVSKAFQTGKWSTDLEGRLGSLEKRFDKAGLEMSRLATEVQGLPERFRQMFTDKEAFSEFRHESREERRRLWDNVEDLRKTLTMERRTRTRD